MKSIKLVVGAIVLIVVIIIALVVLQTLGVLNFAALETIRETGLLTWFKNLWLDHVTANWNEYIVPLWH